MPTSFQHLRLPWILWALWASVRYLLVSLAASFLLVSFLLASFLPTSFLSASFLPTSFSTGFFSAILMFCQDHVWNQKQCLDAGFSLALVHKHVKMSVGKYILETTPPHKHVQIKDYNFFSLASLSITFPMNFYFKLQNISDYTINSS